jgi:hypothetical protein
MLIVVVFMPQKSSGTFFTECHCIGVSLVLRYSHELIALPTESPPQAINQPMLPTAKRAPDANRRAASIEGADLMCPNCV